MLRTKTVDFQGLFGRVDFLLLEETLRQAEGERIFRQNLYLHDVSAPGGLRLVKAGDPYLSTDDHFLPRRVTDLDRALKGEAVKLVDLFGDTKVD